MTPTIEAAAVRVEQIHKSFVLGASAVGALRGVDLTISKGEFVALKRPVAEILRGA